MRSGFWAIAGFTGILLFLPVGILVLHAGQFVPVLKTSGGLAAIGTTLASGALALGIDILLGIPIAWQLARRLGPSYQRLAAAILIVPLLMPPLVLGLVLAYVAGPTTPVGSVFDLSNTFLGLVVAEVYESLPYFVFTAWGYIRTIPRSLEEDAWVLGKSPEETFRFVTWPMARPGLAVAAAMAWARVVGAFGAPIVVAYHPSALPVAIWIQLQEQGLPAALGLSLWLIVVSLPLPVWINWRYHHADR